MKISVIIPAFNEEKTIYACLKALVKQSFDKDEYEIILVNNNSGDKTKEISQSFEKVKTIDEPKQGCVHALIKGCQEAQGEILVFTDADTIVPQNWLENYWRAYQDKNIVIAGGPARFSPRIWQTIFFVEPVLYATGLLGFPVCGFNFSIRRQTYFQINGFNPKINFNADADLQMKAKKMGQKVFLKNNFVITSSRRYKGRNGFSYIGKSIINVLCLFVFKKTLFYEFGNIREK